MAIVLPSLYLNFIDIMILLAVIVSLFGLAWKTQEKLRYAFIILALSLVAIVVVVPVDGIIVKNLTTFGLAAIPILWIVDSLLPPYPTSEFVFILILKMVKEDAPLWLGEVIGLGTAGLMLLLIGAFIPNALSAIWEMITYSLSHITILTGTLFLIWTAVFVIIAKQEGGNK